MDKDKLELINSINLRIKKLEVDIKDLREETKPLAPDCAIGRVSRMDAINNASVNIATLRKKENQLNSLKSALKNIDQNDFGVCVSCGKNIQNQRLLLVPESKYCVKCARKR